MNVDVDALLRDELLSVPEGFARRVMCEVYAQPSPEMVSRKRERLQWIALIAAAGLGVSQVLAFIFGMWATSAAL